MPEIQAMIERSGATVVVLDDDPTGTQTVHGIPVLTTWSVKSLRAELKKDLPVFYVLTNSRSLPSREAQALNHRIGRNLIKAASLAARKITVISRSDSTLRGHFPEEVYTLAHSLGENFDGLLIIPFFGKGGRYTIGDIHYVQEEDDLVPVGETVFAQDAYFGYHASNLRQWVEEKTEGNISYKEVASISIDDIRLGGPNRVADLLLSLTDFTICVVNAASTCDLQVFVRGLLAAEERGKRYLYRTAASIVPIRSGIPPQPILARGDFNLSKRSGALLIVGSFVPLTTSQLNHLLTQKDLFAIELHVQALLVKGKREEEIERVASLADQNLSNGVDTVIYTSRSLSPGENSESSLAINRKVSDSLVNVIRSITTRPRYLLCKGGITSSDVATRGLDVKRALVFGQIQEGVPVWVLGSESRFPDLIYVVFPGNVGEPDALSQILNLLRR